MSVRYDDKSERFILETANTCYVMQILFDKYPVHLYYGKKDGCCEVSYMNPYKSFSPYFEEHGQNYSPDVGNGGVFLFRERGFSYYAAADKKQERRQCNAFYI